MQHIVIDPHGAARSATSAFVVPCTREAIGAAVDAFLAHLDALDGDADLEANGDELDGTGGEDDFCDHGYNYGAGCPVSDPDYGAEERGEREEF